MEQIQKSLKELIELLRQSSCRTSEQAGDSQDEMKAIDRRKDAS